ELGVDSDGFFAWNKRPDTVAIAGSGYIAVELAGVLNSLGAKVTLLLRTERMLKRFDDMLGDALFEHMQEAGIDVRTNTRVQALEADGQDVRAQFDDGSAQTFKQMLWAVGRQPNTADLGLGDIGVTTDARGAVIVDAFQDTAVEGIHA